MTIKLDSIDFFELSGWEITFIVFGSLIAFIIMYYVFKELWKYIQKRRKLVRLQTDLIDDRSSEKVSEDRHSS